MAILVYIETNESGIKKGSLEALTYASKLNEEVIGFAFGNHVDNSKLTALGNYGAEKIYWIKGLDNPEPEQIAEVLGKYFSEDSSITVMGHSASACMVGGYLGVKTEAAVITNISDMPDTSEGFTVKRGIFTGKATETVQIDSAKKILVIKKNVVELKESGSEASVEEIQFDGQESKVKLLSSEKAEGDILLPEAEKVVSAGRGLKGPENWGMIEELAGLLGAATACSKPVSDMEWRPHHEHVGQTGIKISPQLYIAVGISGAIQHLAGVNSSKVIVVINKDPEAPFFSEADYGIVGDAFEVVPKLVEILKSSS